MTQQPYYPPQYPAYPQQAPQQPYAPPAPVYPQQGYPQGYPQQAPQPPAVPLSNGTLDDFYSQPSGGGGPAVSWKGKPDGSWIQGTVTRDVTNGDVIHDTDPVTQQPKFYRDGRPQYVMKVPLKVTPSQEFPEGEAVLFVRGQLRDELTRAMTAANAAPSPKAGDQLVVQLTHRKPSRQGSPQNVFAVQYVAAQPGQGAGASSPAPAPQAPTAPSPAVGQPTPPVQQAPQFQGVDFSQLQAPQMQAPQAPAPAPVFQQPAQAPQAPAPTLAPQAPAPQGGQLPPQFTPEQAELFARLAGQQQAG